MKLFSRRSFLRVLAALLALMLALSLGGCGQKGNTTQLSVDLTGRLTTLDSLLTSTSLEGSIMLNSMEGLLRQLPDGTITEGVAEKYTVSADGLTFTFQLREDAQWSDGTPLTADDFVFTFQRMFSGNGGEETPKQYDAIRGAAEYRQSGDLGVTATGSHTLVIRLAHSDPLMLQKLCQPAAYPCNRGFYESTHSRYGTGLEYVIFNGPFIVSQWENDKVILKENPHYKGISAAHVGSVTCYLNREDALAAFTEGETDFYAVDYATAESLSENKCTILSYSNGMVDLLLNNQAGSPIENADLRRALCLSMELQAYVEERLPEYCDYTSSLAPASARVFDESYYDLLKKGFALGSVTYTYGDSSQTVTDDRFSNQIGITYDGAAAQSALEASGVKSDSGLTILLPKDSVYLDFAGWLQKQWYEHLRIFVNLETVDDATYQKRIAAGDFGITVYSYAAGDDLDHLFRNFLADGNAPVKLEDNRVSQLLDQAAGAANIAEAVRLYANAEALLLGHYSVMPIATASSYFAMRKGVTGIALSSDGENIFFASASVK